MSTVVTAEPPALLRCTQCRGEMRLPPPGLRADLVAMAMLKFIARHERQDTSPTSRLYDGIIGFGCAPRPHAREESRKSSPGGTEG